MAGGWMASGEADRASSRRDSGRLAAMLAAEDPAMAVEGFINAAQPAGSAPVSVTALELHLIRGISHVDLGSGPTDTVIYRPEFMFVATVGRSARAGVSVFWDAGQGLGDPGFPDFGSAKLRSVSGAAPSDLIYPDVAGDLILGIDGNADVASITAQLQAQGLRDVQINGTFGTARCTLFEERATARRLPGSVAGLRYAEANALLRNIDFAPGWSVRRLV